MIEEQGSIELKILTAQRAAEVRHEELKNLQSKRQNVFLDNNVRLQLAASMKQRLLAEIQK